MSEPGSCKGNENSTPRMSELGSCKEDTAARARRTVTFCLKHLGNLGSL